MKDNANLRKWSALLIAIIAYFIIHEGSHALAAMAYGAFEKIHLLGLGVQVVAKTELLTDFQVAYIFVWLAASALCCQPICWLP